MADGIELGEGHSPAAWTGVTVMLIGFAVGTVAFYLAIVWLVWASVAVIIVGLLAGIVLARLGFGVRGPRYAGRDHS